jgi:hypothetical protein
MNFSVRFFEKKMESGPKLAFHNELPMWTIMLVVHFLIDLSYAYTK